MEKTLWKYWQKQFFLRFWVPLLQLHSLRAERFPRRGPFFWIWGIFSCFFAIFYIFFEKSSKNTSKHKRVAAKFATQIGALHFPAIKFCRVNIPKYYFSKFQYFFKNYPFSKPWKAGTLAKSCVMIPSTRCALQIIHTIKFQSVNI